MMYFLTRSARWNQIRARAPIKTRADYKGKKPGCPKGAGHISEAGRRTGDDFGGEIYQALQMATMTAPILCPSSTGRCFGEVTKYNIGPGWHQPSSTFGVMINKGVWAKLPADLKVIVEKAAQANVAYISSWYEAGNIEALGLFQKAGSQIFKLSNAELKKIEEYAWEYLVDEAKKNPDYQMAALSMFQFLKDFAVARKPRTVFSGTESLLLAETSRPEVMVIDPNRTERPAFSGRFRPHPRERGSRYENMAWLLQKNRYLQPLDRDRLQLFDDPIDVAGRL